MKASRCFIYSFLLLLSLAGCADNDIFTTTSFEQSENSDAISLVQDFYNRHYPQSRAMTRQLIVKEIRQISQSPSSRADNDALTTVSFSTGETEGYAILAGEGCNQEILFFTDNGHLDKIPEIAPLSAAFPSLGGFIPGTPIDTTKIDFGQQVDSAKQDVNFPMIYPLIKTKFHHGFPYNIHTALWDQDTCSCVECSKNGGLKRNHIYLTAFMNAAYGGGFYPHTLVVPPFDNFTVPDYGYKDVPEYLLRRSWEFFRVSVALGLRTYCASEPAPLFEDVYNHLRDTISYSPVEYYSETEALYLYPSVIDIKSVNDFKVEQKKIYNSLKFHVPVIVLKKGTAWNIDGYDGMFDLAYYHIVTCYDESESDGWISTSRLYNAFKGECSLILDYGRHENICVGTKRQ